MSTTNSYQVVATIIEDGEAVDCFHIFNTCRAAWNEANNIAYIYRCTVQLFENGILISSIS